MEASSSGTFCLLSVFECIRCPEGWGTEAEEEGGQSQPRRTLPPNGYNKLRSCEGREVRQHTGGGEAPSKAGYLTKRESKEFADGSTQDLQEERSQGRL